jgi:sugar phosphate isomerase/epimerase
LARLLLNTVALEPNRWTPEKVAHFRLHQLLEPIARFGFGAAEVWQYHISREPEAEIRSLRVAADAVGLQLPVVGFYPVLHLTGNAAGEMFEDAQRVFRAAAILGAEAVKIFVGNSASAVLSQQEFRQSVTALRTLAEIAGRNGLMLIGETHEETLFDTVDTCRRVLGDIGASNFRICFQPFDFSDTARTVADYHALAPDVVHLHFQGRRGNEMSLLEDADVDYRVLARALARNGFEGFASIEFVKDCVVDTPAQFDMVRVLDNACRDARFLRRAFAESGLPLSDGLDPEESSSPA